MKRTTVWLGVVATGFFLPSCSLFKTEKAKPPEKKEEKKPKTRLIGRIASVSADKTFVLIQSYGAGEIEAGGILTTRGSDERVANLRCTGEKLGQFAAADIQAGTPQPGDAVFHTPPLPVTESDRSPAAPAKPAEPSASPSARKNQEIPKT